MTHLFLDLETLDTRPTAVVTEIAAVAYDASTFTPQETFTTTLDVADQLATGRTYSAPTIRWAQRKGVLPANWLHGPVDVAIDHLLGLISRHQPAELWTWGKDFDRPILESLLADYGHSFPFHFGDIHCARDAFHIAFHGTQRKPRPKTHHAIDDCLVSIADLQDALVALRRRPVPPALSPCPA